MNKNIPTSSGVSFLALNSTKNADTYNTQIYNLIPPLMQNNKEHDHVDREKQRMKVLLAASGMYLYRRLLSCGNLLHSKHGLLHG